MTAQNHPEAARVPIRKELVSYESRLEKRESDAITLLVIHCTELPDLNKAREFAEVIHYEASQTGNSGHYYIDRDGTVLQYVSNNRVAHHVRGHNEYSIGIELINQGRYPNWYHSQNQTMTQTYTKAQLTALAELVQRLEHELPSLELIAGHEDLDRERIPASDRENVMIRRKVDPGPHFPWSEILSQTRLKRHIP